MYAESLAEVFGIIQYEIYTYMKVFCSAAYTLKEIILHVFLRLSALTLSPVYDQEIAITIYNTKLLFVNNWKDVSSIWFQPMSFLAYYVSLFVLGICCLEIKLCGAIFNHFIYVGIHVNPVNGFMCQ